MNSSLGVQHQIDLYDNLCPDKFSTSYETNDFHGFRNDEFNDYSQYWNCNNQKYQQNRNPMIYERVTQRTRIHIQPDYLYNFDQSEAKYNSSCFYQNPTHSTKLPIENIPQLKYDNNEYCPVMMDKMYNSPPPMYPSNGYCYNEFPQHLAAANFNALLHGNFQDLCLSPGNSASSDDDSTLSEQSHQYTGSEQAYICPDTNGKCLVPQKRRGKQLWKFLFSLLQEEEFKNVICWSENGKSHFEFKLLEPEEVATLWGKEKGKPNMNYDKLSRSLRFYYQKNLIQKVGGDHYVYKFPINPERLIKYIDTQSKRPRATRNSRCSIDNQRIHPYSINPYTRTNSITSCSLSNLHPPPNTNDFFNCMALPLTHDDMSGFQLTYPSS